MSKKVITVLGATGTQGGSVVSTFAQEADWHIRAVTRNPSSTAAQALKSKYPNIDVVQADTNDVNSLKRVFAGSIAIFAVTDYWAPFNDAAIRSQHTTGDSLRRWAYDEEVKQGRNIADAAAAQVSNGRDSLRRLVWSSLPSPKKYSHGKYAHIYHFDSKAVVTEYIHTTHPQLAALMNVILVGFYVSNMLRSNLMQPIKRPDGSFLIQRLCPADSVHPFILTHQDTGPFTRALVLDPGAGKTLLASTAMLSWADMGRLWARAVKLPLAPAYREVTLDEFKRQFPIDGEELLSATYSAEYGFAGKDPDVLEAKDLGFEERPQQIEAWFAEQDWSAVLNAKPRDS